MALARFKRRVACSRLATRNLSIWYRRSTGCRPGRETKITQNIAYREPFRDQFRTDRLIYSCPYKWEVAILRCGWSTGLASSLLLTFSTEWRSLAIWGVILGCGIAGLTHARARRYIRQLVVCRGGKDISLATTTWTGGLQVQRVPLCRIEMTIGQVSNLLVLTEDVRQGGIHKNSEL
mmetsp:Transcript_34866/g.64555  ORF Transcript_34866/g.64555 Transcript_34866/m.64555 type:complete len:178 (+) Transcript_34866:26-559(+)